MDLSAIAFGDGLALTSDDLETKINTIVSHQLTRQDWADGFVWGMDVDADGEGIIAASHINGTITDVRHFGGGTDADAIQLAVDWVEATSEGEGYVFLPPVATNYSIDHTINVPTGIALIGHGTVLQLAFNGYVFTLDASCQQVLVSGFKLDAQQKSAGGLVYGAGTTSDCRVENCLMGIPAAETTTYGGAYLFEVNGDAFRCLVRGNRVGGGGGLFKCGGGERNRILDNRFDVPGTHTSAQNYIDLLSCNECVIGQNVGTFWSGSSTGPERILQMNDCDYVKIHDNYFEGGEQYTVFMTSCEHCEITTNRFLNGNTDGSLAVMKLDTACDHNRIYGNIISCDGDLSTPSNADYGLWLNGAPAPDQNIIHDNIFEDLSSFTGPVGQYVCATAGLKDQGTNTRRWGNHYFQGQRYVGTVTVTVLPDGWVDCPGCEGQNGASNADRHAQILGWKCYAVSTLGSPINAELINNAATADRIGIRDLAQGLVSAHNMDTGSTCLILGEG
jgi:hypothetical protein